MYVAFFICTKYQILLFAELFNCLLNSTSSMSLKPIKVNGETMDVPLNNHSIKMAASDIGYVHVGGTN